MGRQADDDCQVPDADHFQIADRVDAPRIGDYRLDLDCRDALHAVWVSERGDLPFRDGALPRRLADSSAIGCLRQCIGPSQALFAPPLAIARIDSKDFAASIPPTPPVCV